jgi:general secretion pathway protein D
MGAAVWVSLCAVLLVGSVRLHAESASGYFKRGVAAEAREDYDAALDNYQKARNKAPKDLRYRTALYRIRTTASAMHLTKGRKLLQAGDQPGALTEFLHAAEIDPGNEAADQEIARVRAKQGVVAPESETSLPEAVGKMQEIDSIGAPVELKPVANEPLTLHMTEDTKNVYQAVGKAAGINVLFDPDYNSKRIQVDLTNMGLLDALRIVGTMSNTFWRPVTSNTIFVAQNSRAKRTELEEQAVQTFYLSNAWQQNDLNDVQTALRNVLPNAKVYGVASQNAIVMRATPDELLLAQKLVNDLDKARPEVVVDIAVLEVSKNWERTIGIQWPSSVGIALQSPSQSSTSTTGTTTGTTGTTGETGTSPTLYDLSHLKAYDFAVTIGSATANLLLTDSDTKILQNPRIRATDSQKATMKIGSRIPIATGSYQTGAATAAVSSLVNTQFQYQDVGVNVEITPTVHFDNDVTLKIKIEVTSQSGSVTISGVTEPIISQRVAEQVIRLREGEANIIGGINENQVQQSWSGIPGLSSIPILRYLFGSKDHTINDDEIVFLVVPHVVRQQDLTQANLRTIDTGVGTAIELRHTTSDGSTAAPGAGPGSGPGAAPGSAPGSAPGTGPAAPSGPGRNPALPPVRPARSTVGTVPGATAEAAGPAALAQMRAAAASAGDTAAAAVSVPQPQMAPPLTDKVSYVLGAPPGPFAPGATIQVPIRLIGGHDIFSTPFDVKYDKDKLSLISAVPGEFLGREGQAPMLQHIDDGAGNIQINASRPPGADGVSGDGVVCVLSFQAKAAGSSELAIVAHPAVTAGQQHIPAQGARTSIVVQ